MPDDVISLNPSLRYTGTVIVDEIIGIQHTVQSSAYSVMSMLVQGVTYSTLHEPSCHFSETQLQELLGFLNIIGALKKQQSRHHAARATYEIIQHAFYGATYPALGKRYADTFRGILLAIIRACRDVIIASGIVAVVASFAGLYTVHTIIFLYGTSMCTFVGSIIAHEWAHVLCIHRAGKRAIILQRGLHIQILHRPLSPASDIRAALAGPLTGASVAGIIGFTNTQVLLGVIAYCIAAMHIVSLLPYYADGKSLTRAFLNPKRDPAHETNTRGS